MRQVQASNSLNLQTLDERIKQAKENVVEEIKRSDSFLASSKSI